MHRIIILIFASLITIYSRKPQTKTITTFLHNKFIQQTTINITICPNNCSNNGQCNNITLACKCDSSYAFLDCSYKKLSRHTAYYLSIFVPFTGADRFYLGYTAIGIAKLLYLFSIMCFPISYLFLRHRVYTNFRLVFLIFMVFFFTGFGWYLADVIMIGMGTLTDANGVYTNCDAYLYNKNNPNQKMIIGGNCN
jgi:hypothetical protein